MPICSNDGRLAAVGSNCRNFDFTVAFEDVLLSIVPEALFGASFVLRSCYLAVNAKGLTTRKLDWLYYVKQLLVTGTIAAKLLSLILLLKASQPSWPYPVTTVSYALSLLVSLLLFPLIHLEHTRTLQSSTLLSSYVLLLVLFDATRIRTYVFATLTQQGWFVSFVAAFGIRFVLLVMESINLNYLLLPEHKVQPPSATTNIFSRYLLLWLVPLFNRGRKSRLTLDDLADVDHSMQSEELSRRFDDAWNRERTRQRPSLLRASLYAFPLEFLATFPPGIVWVLATFAQPYILSDLLNFINSYQDNSGAGQPVNIGIGLVCAYGLVYIVISLAYTLLQLASVRLCVKFRGAIVSSLFAKALLLHTTAARELGASSAYNLMSVDVERFVLALVGFSQTWTAALSLGFGLWLLWREVGLFFLVALGLLFLLFAGLPHLGNLTDRSQARFSVDSDKRVKTTASVINNVKSMKLSGYKDFIVHYIISLRQTEISSLKKYFQASSAAMLIACVLPVWLEFLIYASYGGYVTTHNSLGKTLGTNKIFTILSILHIISDPLVNASVIFPSLYGAYVSLRRLQVFLVAEEVENLAHNKAPEKRTNHENHGPESDKSIRALKIQDVSVNWKMPSATDNTLLLKSLNLELEPGRFTMVVGRVGSGKSTLLHTLLSEIRILSGSVYNPWLTAPVAYCAQDAWILNATVRANIIMSRPFDEARYSKITSACSLREDFGNWQHGDLTATGARGSALSGGQKQRIGLARALYADVDVYLLDDVLSAVDPRVERRIFDSLFGLHGLLKDKTVVMVGHNVGHLDRADQILVLDEGLTVEQGPPTQLLSNPNSSLARYVDQLDKREEESPAEDEEAVSEDVSAETEDNLDQEVVSALEGKRFRVYDFWARNSGYFNTILFAFIATVISAPYLLPQVILTQWGAANDATPNANTSRFIGALAGVTVAHSMLCTLVMWLLYQRVAPHGAINMHTAMLKGLMSTSLSFFDSTPAGRIVNRFSQDLYIVTVELPQYAFLFLSNTADLVVLLAYTIIASPYLAIAIPPLGVIYYLITSFYIRTSRQIRRLDLAAKSPLYQHFGEAFEGLMTIRAFKMEQWFLETNRQLMDTSQKPFYLRFMAQAWLALYLNLIVTIIAVLLSAIAVSLRHSVAVGFLGVALSNLIILSGTLNRIMSFYATLETSVVAIERVQEYSTLFPEESRENGDATSNERPTGWPRQGSVSFEDVTIKYRPDLDPALRGLTFEVQPGQKLGIVGRSGSGKTTVLMSLFRVINPESGMIRIDGIDTSHISPDLIRNSISIIPQEPFLFDGSIRENLVPSLEDKIFIGDAAIWSVLEKINMKDLVAGLKGGLDHVISSDGDRFSRGQKQLLCFARALLRGQRIMVLDEATSSVDPDTDQLIQRLIREELADRTVITIAHRIETILDYDQVMVLQGGELQEKGSPRELLENPDSMFQSMVRSETDASEYGGPAGSEYGGPAESEYGGPAESEQGGPAESEQSGTTES